MTIIRQIEVTESALPTGAATSAAQTTGNSSLSSIDAKTPALSAGKVPVDGSGVTQPISAASLPLPSGAATESTLSSMSAKIPALSGGNVPVLAAQSGTWAVTDGGGSLTVDGTVGISGSVAVTGGLTDAQLRATPVPVSGTVAVTGAGDATAANQSALNTLTGAVNESAPGTDTASSGLNGRLQRIAQRITSLITAVGSPFQAGGSIGNTAFGVNNGSGASAVNIQDGGNSITVDGAVSAAQSGTWTVTGAGGTFPVTGTFFQATQPVSIASAVPVTDNGGSLTVDGTVGISGSVAVTGTFFQATQPVSGTVTANATLAAETTKVIGTVNPPALTIGTNNANGFTVQPARDAGRVAVRYYSVASASGTSGTETAITLTKSADNGATSTGTSFVITNGKRFRIQAITFATRGNNTATAQTTTFNFRVNTAGAVTTASTPVVLAIRSATPATANAWDRVFVQIPDGWEILGNGTIQFGVTAAATFVTNAPTWDVSIIGYEY